MLRAVIFDMDGLLIDSEPLWVRAEIEVFAGAGLDISRDDCARTKGLRVDDVVAYWHAKRGFRGATPTEVQGRLVARVVELVKSEGQALPGVGAALEVARMGGRRVAVASSSPTAILDAALERLGLADEVDVIQSAEHEPHGKPHPGVFLRAAERLDVSPLECVVIEDSLTGVIAAKAARMGCVAVPLDHPHQEERFVLADAILGSLADVTTDLLERVSA